MALCHRAGWAVVLEQINSTATPAPGNIFMSPCAAAWWISGMNSCFSAEFKMEARTLPPNFQIPSFRESRRRLHCFARVPLQAGNPKLSPTFVGPQTAGPIASCHIPSSAQSWPLGCLFKKREEICTSVRCFGLWAELRKYPYISYMDC